MPALQATLGQRVAQEDVCLYNEVSLFEVIALRKLAPSSVRVYNKWYDRMFDKQDNAPIQEMSIAPALNLTTERNLGSSSAQRVQQMLSGAPMHIRGTRD